MSVTESLFRPLLSAPARPLITYYDDADGSRVELSRATVANWAAKTANWLRDECDVEPGAEVAVRLPAHWQTLGVLLGAWWCGAVVTDAATGTEVAFVTPDDQQTDAQTLAIVALDPLGRGLGHEPTGGAVDYLTEIRAYGDDFDPWQPIPGDASALGALTVDDVVVIAREHAARLGIGSGSRVMSTRDWAFPDGIVAGPLAVLAVGASLVQCGHADPAKLPDRRAAERVTIDLG